MRAIGLLRTAFGIQRSIVRDVDVGEATMHVRTHSLALVRCSEDSNRRHTRQNVLAIRRPAVVVLRAVVARDEVDGGESHSQEAIGVGEGRRDGSGAGRAGRAPGGLSRHASEVLRASVRVTETETGGGGVREMLGRRSRRARGDDEDLKRCNWWEEWSGQYVRRQSGR